MTKKLLQRRMASVGKWGSPNKHVGPLVVASCKKIEVKGSREHQPGTSMQTVILQNGLTRKSLGQLKVPKSVAGTDGSPSCMFYSESTYY